MSPVSPLTEDWIELEHPSKSPSKIKSFWIHMQDAFMCWPDFSLKISFLPWHWTLLPRFFHDYSPRSGDHVGWWGVSLRWLFIDVDLGWNLPPFTWKNL